MGNKDTPGCLQRLGWRMLLPKASLGLYRLSTRCTFDINSLSGMFNLITTFADGQWCSCILLFCLAQLLAPCGSCAVAESVSVCQWCSQVVWLLIWLTFRLNSVGWLRKPSQFRSLKNNQLIAWARRLAWTAKWWSACYSLIDWYSAVRKVTWLQDRAEK